MRLVHGMDHAGLVGAALEIERSREFKRCFEPEDETFRKELTGSKRLPTQCGFCSYLGSCWPHAQHLPQTMSQAKSPRHYWYTEYEGEVLDGNQD